MLLDGLANLDGVRGFSLGERLGGVFKTEAGTVLQSELCPYAVWDAYRRGVLLGKLSNEFCVFRGKPRVSLAWQSSSSSPDGLFPVVVKDDFSEKARGSVVHVNDDVF